METPTAFQSAARLLLLLRDRGLPILESAHEINALRPDNPVARAAMLLREIQTPTSVPDLQQRLNVSPAQLRRDVAALKKAGWHLASWGRPKMLYAVPLRPAPPPGTGGG